MTILDRARPIEQIITYPPLAVFEILLPEDRIQRMLRKLADYEAMGMAEIWVIDPDSRIFSRYSAGELQRRTEFTVAIHGIDFPTVAIESLLD